MNRVFDFTKEKKMKELTPQQQRFTAMMMVREIQKYAVTHDVSEEAVYELYQKGMLGADRTLG